MRTDLGFSQTNLQWVVNAYTVCFGGFLLLGGRAGDLLGKRRVLLGGIALFTAASLASGLAQNANTLIATRALQGLSCAFVSPMTLALIAVSFPEGKPRNLALGLYGGIAGISSALGVTHRRPAGERPRLALDLLYKYPGGPLPARRGPTLPAGRPRRPSPPPLRPTSAR